jgi:hypothetical protein
MPNLHFPTKTLAAFEEAIQRDQGAKFRGFLRKVLPHINDAYREEEEPHRHHLGASLVGGDCARSIWYNFRWATKSNFSGRMLRLFNRGHLEEGRLIACLLTIGCEVYQQDEHGKQYRITHADGHMGGSGDGVVVGLPDLPPGTAALLEFKTHNEKSFTELKAKGVKEAKPEHYIQSNIYMRKMALPIALYLAVNKNTDEIYGELLPLNPQIADQFLARGEKLVWMDQPPTRLSETPGFWKCRFCDHRPVCFLKAAPDRNCRTCIYASPMTGNSGLWGCTMHNRYLDKKEQFTGCDKYTLNHHHYEHRPA